MASNEVSPMSSTSIIKESWNSPPAADDDACPLDACLDFAADAAMALTTFESITLDDDELRAASHKSTTSEALKPEFAARISPVGRI